MTSKLSCDDADDDAEPAVYSDITRRLRRDSHPTESIYTLCLSVRPSVCYSVFLSVSLCFICLLCFLYSFSLSIVT